MKRLLIALFLLVSSLVHAQSWELQSPNKNLKAHLSLGPDGQLTYGLAYKGKKIVIDGHLGLELKDDVGFTKGLAFESVQLASADNLWHPVWGEERSIRNQYNELALTVVQKQGKKLHMLVRLRLFDHGMGFRYEFPGQDNLTYFVLTDEKTSFGLSGDHFAWWIPGDYDTNEYFYSNTRLSAVDAVAMGNATEISTRKVWTRKAVQTPLMMKSDDGLYINIHEASLVNYPAMQLEISGTTLQSHLVPDAVGNKAYLKAPFNTPWRVINVSDQATDILASRVILNLNEPSKIADPSFIKPQKMVGVWWEMHVGKSTWDYAGTQNASTSGLESKPSGKHGATTANVKRYIDFAAKHGIDGVLVEGWNVGWEDWFGKWKEEVFDFITPYPDFDVKELQRYAASKNVKIIMHHETSGSATNYERYMDTAFRFMKNHGYDAVKTGYVGRIIPRGEWHDGQWMINHYLRQIIKAASYGIMVDAHEPVRPTGLHRTWPNFLACEAARGNEFNAWSVGNPPAHETILPFTRLMGGPMDYTPGIFEIKMSTYDPNKKEQVHTTLAKQLALYVTMYSPLQMAADLPENYEKHLDAFEFIKQVAVDWDSTVYLEAEPGAYLSIARKAKNSNNWFLGAITNEHARTAILPLGFLPAGKTYEVTIYQDGKDAHWEKNPKSYQVLKQKADSKTILKIPLAPGGGAAIHIR